MKKLMFLTVVFCLMMLFSGSVSAQKVSREYSGVFGKLVGDGIWFLPQEGDEIKIDLLPGRNGAKYISVNFYKPLIPVGITATMNPSPKDHKYVLPANKGKIKNVNTDVKTKNLHFKPNDMVKVTFFENENRMMDVEVIRGGKSQGKIRIKW